MIFAAGMGTRLKPFTDKHPKALAVVNNKTLLQRNIEYLQQFGIYNVIINVHHFSNQIINALEENKGWGSDVLISNETDEVLETGGGLKKAAWYFKNENDFVVMNADVLTDMHLNEMIHQHQQKKCLATLAVSDRISSRSFLFNANNELCGWQNAQTNEQKIVRASETFIPKAFSGIHVINTSIFSLIQQERKFSMVDIYLSLASKYNIVSFNHSGSKFIDVGKPENIIKAESLFI